MGHKTLEDVGYNRKYWDYSFDDLVQYDVVANVEHVLRVSGRERVIYIGHS